MRVLLLLPDTGVHGQELLGVPVGMRAVFAAIDAGASEIEYEAQDGTERAALLRTWAQDERMTRPLRARSVANAAQPPARAHSVEERLVLRADAVVSPALLTELAPGAALCDASGVNVAARLMLDEGADAAAALAAASAQAFTPDRYRYAILLTSKHERRRARRALLAALVKPSDGPVSRHLNRPISIAITRLLVPLGVSADQMTWVTALVALAGAWLAAHTDWRSQALGAVLFQASSVLDGCDGEIARLTRRSSPSGALFDSLVDDLSNFLFFTGLSWGVAHDIAHDGARWPMIAGTATALSYLGVITVQYAVVLRATGYGDKTSFWVAESGAQHSPLMAFFHGFLRRNVFVVVIMLAVLADGAAWVVALLPFATFGTLSASVRRALAT